MSETTKQSSKQTATEVKKEWKFIWADEVKSVSKDGLVTFINWKTEQYGASLAEKLVTPEAVTAEDLEKRKLEIFFTMTWLFIVENELFKPYDSNNPKEVEDYEQRGLRIGSDMILTFDKLRLNDYSMANIIPMYSEFIDQFVSFPMRAFMQSMELVDSDIYEKTYGVKRGEATYSQKLSILKRLEKCE